MKKGLLSQLLPLGIILVLFFGTIYLALPDSWIEMAQIWTGDLLYKQYF